MTTFLTSEITCFAGVTRSFGEILFVEYIVA